MKNKMKTQKLLLLALLFSVAFMPLIMADDTTIIVKTLPNHTYDVLLTILNANNPDAMPFSVENDTNSDGTLTYVYSSATQTIIFSVTAWLNGTIAGKRIFNTTVYHTGGSIVLDLFGVDNNPVSPPPAPINLTANVTNNTIILNSTINITNGNQTVILNPKSSNSLFSKINWGKILMWIGIIIGAIIVIVLIIFGIIILIRKIKSMPSSMGESKKSKGDVAVISNKMEKELVEAERKIKEAQETIDFIKNKKSKVSEAERRFEEAKKELERLRRY